MNFTDRKHSLLRCLAVFAAVQAASAMIVWYSFSVHVRGRLLLHVLTGPFNVLGRLDRLKYHSFLSNAGFLLFCTTVAVLPFIHWKYPRRGTLALAAAGSVLWALIGAGFSIRHM